MGDEYPYVGTPQDWLRFAQSDLALARGTPGEEVLPESLCFHAQQAVEKALKGVLLARGVDFPYTHDISRLIALIKASGIAFPHSLADAAILTVYAVTGRYPGNWDVVEEDDVQSALDLAVGVLTWARRFITETR